MENNRNHETSSGKDETVRYVLSADELQGIIRRALDEGGDRAGRRDRTENGDRSGADDRADRNGTAGTQSRWQSGFTGEGEYVIDLKMAMTALAKRWWIILLATLIGGLVMLGYARYNYSPQYRATIKLYVTNNTTAGNVTVISTSDIVAAQTLIPTYNEILLTRDFLDKSNGGVIEKYKAATGKDITFAQLSDMLVSGAVPDTQIYYVTVTSGDPDQAMKLANIIYDELPRKLQEKVQGSSVEQIDKAASAVLVTPNFGSKVLIGALLGLVLSAGYAILVGCVLNDKLESAAWLSSAFPSVPVLAQIPDTQRGSSRNDYDGYGYDYGYGYGYGYGYEQASRPAHHAKSKSHKEDEADKTGKADTTGKTDAVTKDTAGTDGADASGRKGE